MSLQLNHLVKVMAFLEKIYASGQKFLCFPVMQNIVFTREQFDLLDKDPLDGEDGQAVINISTQWYRFSQIADQVIDPSSAIVDTARGNLLSNIYEDIVDPLVTDFARDTRASESESLAYANAMSVLYADGGNSSLSVKWMQYKACKTAWEMSAELLKSRSVDVSLSNDATVLQKWPAEKAELEKAVKDAEEKWNHEGFRSEIEQALFAKDIFESRSPAVRQAQLREKLQKFSTTDIGTNDDYFSTSYSPRGLAGTAWPRHRITGNMLRKISVDDNPRLKALIEAIGGDNADPGLQEISFEMAECKLYRPWAEEDVFNRRYWKFKDPGKILSDGFSTVQASGECPAYISGLVFIRNIQLLFAAKPRITVVASSFGPFSVTSTNLTRLQQRTALSGKITVHDRGTRSTTLISSKEKAKRPVDAIRALNSGRLQSKMISAVRVPNAVQNTRVETPRPEQAGVHTEKFLQNEAMVFAFVCKPLLKTPNPSDNYLW